MSGGVEEKWGGVEGGAEGRSNLRTARALGEWRGST